MTKKLKSGDKFVFNNCKSNKATMQECELNREFTIGKVYEVTEEFGVPAFKDDEGDLRPANDGWTNDLKFTKIKE